MTALPAPSATPIPPQRVIKERPRNRPARVTNVLAIAACSLGAALAILLLAAITGYVIYQGVSCFVQFSHGLHFDFSLFTLPTGAGPGEPSGLRNCIAGTLVLITLSSLVGVPVGMLCGIYLAEYAKDGWFSHTVRLIVDVLAGVPSIIVGVLGYQILVKGFYIGPFAFLHVPRVHIYTGFSAWAGALALAFIMVPIVARATEEMLKLVPAAFREASVGLGGFRYQTLGRIILPSAKAGIITGVMLAVARVAGETAPLIMTALVSDQPVFNWAKDRPLVDLNHPFPSLTVQIYTYATSPEDDWRRQAWGGMLILVAIILLLNIAVRYFSRNRMLRPAK